MLRTFACAALLAGCATMTSTSEPAASLAAAETAFAAHSVREDMRAAFLSHFAPDGVLVRDGWTVARTWLEPRPAPPIVLDWRPQYVEAAASGDLGLSTGPWKATPRSGGKPGYGQFVSIWKREPGGAWRVAVDLGISHAGPALWDAPLAARTSPARAGSGSIADAERAFAAAFASGGAQAAYAAFAADDIRLYRDGHAPSAGRTPALDLAAREARPLAWSVERIETAASGEFGYARGHYTAGGAAAAGHYLRVWRHEPAGWRIALDVVNAANA